MTLLKILEFPDPRLRRQAKPVASVDDSTRHLIKQMFATMYAAPGVGLAATQVNVHEQVVVLDVSEDKSQPMVFINPAITILDKTLCNYEEGCLSVPGFTDTVSRPKRVLVRALNEYGQPFEKEAEGLLAVCIQHEVDHLNGKLYVDYLSGLKRSRIRKQLEKKHRDDN